MYCATCGSANRDGATFCDSCGQALTGVPAPTGAQSGVAASAPPPDPAGQALLPPPVPTGTELLPPPRPLAGPGRNPWLVPAIVAFVMVAVGVGVVAYLMASARPAHAPTAGQTPGAYVTAYYQAILDKQWQKAFDMQPAASKQGSTVDAFQQTQETMYGMVSFSIFSDSVNGGTATVVAVQELGGNGTWNTTWTFVQSSDGTWLVQGRVPKSGKPGN